MWWFCKFIWSGKFVNLVHNFVKGKDGVKSEEKVSFVNDAYLEEEVNLVDGIKSEEIVTPYLFLNNSF